MRDPALLLKMDSGSSCFGSKKFSEVSTAGRLLHFASVSICPYAQRAVSLENSTSNIRKLSKQDGSICSHLESEIP